MSRHADVSRRSLPDPDRHGGDVVDVARVLDPAQEFLGPAAELDTAQLRQAFGKLPDARIVLTQGIGKAVGVENQGVAEAEG